jgi:hypothetical protein
MLQIFEAAIFVGAAVLLLGIVVAIVKRML